MTSPGSTPGTPAGAGPSPSDRPPPLAPAPSRTKLPRARTLALALVALALVALAALFGLRDAADPSRCAPGLIALGPRCCGEGQHLEADRCTGAPTRCADAHVLTPTACALRDPAARVTLPAQHLHIGPGDWEAQGVITPRDADVPSFAMDVFEVTESRWQLCAQARACPDLPLTGEPARPVTSVTFDEAAAFCLFAGGRLPTRDEHAVAVSRDGTRRYPWGDTGAVCRRAAWGLAAGPCATGATAPDLAASHPAGRSPEGLHDLAGNAAEWTSLTPSSPLAEAAGGSWSTTEAASLRGWSPNPLPKPTRSPTIGFRCVYTPD